MIKTLKLQVNQLNYRLITDVKEKYDRNPKLVDEGELAQIGEVLLMSLN